MRRRLALLTLPALLAALALLGGCSALLNDGRTGTGEEPITVEGGDAVDRAIAAPDAERLLRISLPAIGSGMIPPRSTALHAHSGRRSTRRRCRTTEAPPIGKMPKDPH